MPGTSITVLGSGTAQPAGGRNPAGYLVDCDGTRFLLDFGPGNLRRLPVAGLPIHELEHVVLTHFHLDHVLDLWAFLFAMHPGVPPRSLPLQVYGPEGLEGYLAAMARAWGDWVEPKGFQVVPHTIRPGETVEIGPALVRAFKSKHSQDSLCYRLETPTGTAAYSGDSDLCEELVQACREVDLAILECSTPDDLKRSGHLSHSTCARVGVGSGARALMLTHFYPECEGLDHASLIRLAGYRGAVLPATDMMVVSLEDLGGP